MSQIWKEEKNLRFLFNFKYFLESMISSVQNISGFFLIHCVLKKKPFISVTCLAICLFTRVADSSWHFLRHGIKWQLILNDAIFKKYNLAAYAISWWSLRPHIFFNYGSVQYFLVHSVFKYFPPKKNTCWSKGLDNKKI